MWLFKKHLNNFPVDLVYLWCDGSDPVFKKNKELLYTKLYGNTKKQESLNDHHFVQINELKYSLRSAEKNVPWIRKIFIVTNKQVPKWLNTKSDKIEIIDHSQIGLSNIYNSVAIESQLYKIPGLSEHFLYANDDTFFNKKVKKSFFFNSKGIPIVHVYKCSTIGCAYLTTIKTASTEIFGVNKFYTAPYHCIAPYTISQFKLVLNSRYSNVYNATSKNPFRSRFDMQKFFISLYNYKMNKTKLVYHKPNKSDHDRVNVYTCYSLGLERIDKYNPKLCCINSSDKDDEKWNKSVIDLFEKKFSSKSSFEI
ncbi:MAG: hypothetical protein Ta2E_06760 [Mycoplasmoidaceae bacterium]|nr:MAG: hypothetical protein Ta2E_06760 [Mycoplasmoidaceae bacterium]